MMKGERQCQQQSIELLNPYCLERQVPKYITKSRHNPVGKIRFLSGFLDVSLNFQSSFKGS